jgi:L-alanine-DL-glutamate epimerase-like enolase superfamily enzyme
MRRDTTPEEEVAWLAARLDETGARAVKVRVGARLGEKADVFPGRTRRLVPLARRTFPDTVALYTDANGGYDAKTAIKVGRMLQRHGVQIFEEPCPFEEFEETKRVADALTMTVAGGEQDTSLPRFEWMVRNRVVDLVQPDVTYNGGFIRTLRVAQAAARAGVPITPHNARLGAEPVYALHFASIATNFSGYLEYNAAPHPHPDWLSPRLEVEHGELRVPDGPGLGIEIDPDALRHAQRLSGS